MAAYFCTMKYIVFAFAALVSTSFSVAAQLEPLESICGDCWCIHNPTGNDSMPNTSTCPEQVEGLSQQFPDSVAAAYESFVDTTPMMLQSAGGGACYPFANAVGPQDNYPGSTNAQCEMPEKEGFCAYLFEDQGQVGTQAECVGGRKYRAVTYATEQAAIDAGAQITHRGACGVCSSAQDLAARMRTYDSLDKTSVLCGTRYFVAGRNFDELVSCYSEEGFTSQCSNLWAHFTATNAALCAQPCLGQEPPFNGPAPQCELTECLQCSGDSFAPDFDLLGGRRLAASGITEDIARPCEDFYPVVHDPCPGLTQEGGTGSGNGTSAAAIGGASFKIGLIALAGSIAGLI